MYTLIEVVMITWGIANFIVFCLGLGPLSEKIGTIKLFALSEFFLLSFACVAIIIADPATLSIVPVVAIFASGACLTIQFLIAL